MRRSLCAFAASAVGGLVVGTPAPASATVMPGLSVSPGAGPGVDGRDPAFRPGEQRLSKREIRIGRGSEWRFHDVAVRRRPRHPVLRDSQILGAQHRRWRRGSTGSRCDATRRTIRQPPITVSVPYKVIAAPSAAFVGMAVSSGGLGYWLAKADGGVVTRGHASFYGSLPNSRIVPSSPDRRDRGAAVGFGILAGRFGRCGLRVRLRTFVRIDAGQAPQPAGRRDRGDGHRKGLLGGRGRRCDLPVR